MTEIICVWCGKESLKPSKEINRQVKLGNTNFFCSKSCSCRFGNTKRNDLVIDIEKKCLWCGNTFKTISGKGEADHCSRSCASFNSVSEARREAGRKVGYAYCAKDGDSVGIARLMKKREAIKYQKLTAYLQGRGLEHEFEKAIGDYVFDLVIEDEKLIFEFDGPDHVSGRVQIKIDAVKNEIARANGYRMIREGVNPNQVIDHLLIEKYLKPAMR